MCLGCAVALFLEAAKPLHHVACGDCARWMQADKAPVPLHAERMVQNWKPIWTAAGFVQTKSFTDRGSGSRFQRFTGGRLCLTLAVEQ